MGRRALILVAALCCAAMALPARASVGGSVTLEGEPPVPDRVIPAAQVSRDCRHHGSIRTENWKVATNGALGDVVVWIQNAPTNAVPVAVREVTQRGCRYIPHAVSMQSSDRMFVSNGDDTLHNVRGQPHPPTGRSLFNIGQAVRGIRSEVRFPGPGRYTLGCDIHPWMEAWVHVFPHGWHAVSDEAGRFALPPGLPDGEYELRAWHPGFREPIVQTLRVSGGVGEASFVFRVSK